MKKNFILLAGLTLVATSSLAQKTDLKSELDSLVNTERAFAKTAGEKSTRDAFLAFIADDGVLFRPYAVEGKKWLLESKPAPGLLSWEPAFADIALSGDLGYTTGPWEFRRSREDEKPVAFGHFVTVWKKQADGVWRFKLDLGISHEAHVSKEELRSPPVDRKAKIAEKIDTKSEIAALVGLERELSNVSFEKGTANAFIPHAADDVRLYREGAYPFVGKPAAREALAKINGAFSWQTMGGDVSRAADLGYTYGTATLNPGGGGKVEYFNYLRIWKRQKNGAWQVALDVASPAPAPAKPAS
jgi:ketosteroid isomerase-like protein